MNDLRRRTLVLAATLLPIARGFSQPWQPTGPTTLLVGFPPGNVTDSAARVLSGELARVIGQPVVVENAPGAGGRVAIDRLAAGAPEGKVLLLAGSEILLTDGRTKLLATASVASVPMVLVGRPNMTLDQLRGLPNPSFYVSGYQPPLLLRQLDIPRKTFSSAPNSGQALADIAAGKLDAAILPYPILRQAIAEGKVRALAAIGADGVEGLVGLPPMPLKQPAIGPGFLGLFASPGTPQSILQGVNGAVAKALQTDEVRKGFASIGIAAAPRSIEVFAQIVQVQYGVTPDSCKKKDTCEKDTECPKPC